MPASHPSSRGQFHITRTIDAQEHIVRAWIDPQSARVGLDFADTRHAPLPDVSGDGPDEGRFPSAEVDVTDPGAAGRATLRVDASEADVGEIEPRLNARLERLAELLARTRPHGQV